MRWLCCFAIAWIVVVALVSLFPPSSALSMRINNPTLSRLDVLNLATGIPIGYVSGKTLRTALSIKDGIVYPPGHEQRLESMIRTALVEAAAAKLASSSSNSDSPLRVLEVGIGSDCRLIRRGFYTTPALQKEMVQRLLPRKKKNGPPKTLQLELTGIDVAEPSPRAWKEAQDIFNTQQPQNQEQQGLLEYRLRFRKESIVPSSASSSWLSSLPDGYFDCVLGCFALCSLDDDSLVLALEETKRLLNPGGGTLGYLEHVKAEPNTVLGIEQRLLDPLQRIVAGNCHLHRSTQDSIRSVFFGDGDDSSILEQERFLVDNLWPISCQCFGVLQRNTQAR